MPLESSGTHTATMPRRSDVITLPASHSDTLAFRGSSMVKTKQNHRVGNTRTSHPGDVMLGTPQAVSLFGGGFLLPASSKEPPHKSGGFPTPSRNLVSLSLSLKRILKKKIVTLPTMQLTLGQSKNHL